MEEGSLTGRIRKVLLGLAYKVLHHRHRQREGDFDPGPGAEARLFHSRYRSSHAERSAERSLTGRLHHLVASGPLSAGTGTGSRRRSAAASASRATSRSSTIGAADIRPVSLAPPCPTCLHNARARPLSPPRPARPALAPICKVFLAAGAPCLICRVC